ncbi:DUF4129 domain-containing protein [Cohnella pontilimi]|uniref:DUF4129 domain-containing protein n=1 Tax=Cohnella pontilimi TaxID=2564100 RepID=A0A4U0FJ49_9BACL|nr:transglutaminase domain-containing protein [Cohnella pontilimi]TJY43492.1 DUF4129 domain-containing protein [Cohnella pontilimi]
MSRSYAQWPAGVKPGAGFWGSLVIERLHRLFVIVILLQLIQCFGDYWWSETYSVLYGVLAVTAVCELAFSRHYALRFTVEMLAAMLFSLAYSPYFEWVGLPGNWHSGDQWDYFYQNHIASLHPFFEMAAGAILFVHAVSWLGQKRAAAVTVLLSAIGIMATVDSFFPLELWKNIAWLVTAGLGWLVVLHLRQLRSRHPESWSALAERPLELALPAVVVISLLLLSGIFMPRAPALLEDPYTIWSEAQGIEVRSVAGEGGVLRAGTSLIGGLGGNASSGYGRDDLTIGGGFDFDYSPVMTVNASRRSYWRGETKAVYSGKGWSDVRSNVSAVEPNPYGILVRQEKLAPGVKMEKVTQTITLIRKDRIPVLFGAGPITTLIDVKSDGRANLGWNPEEWELRWSRPSRVESYTIESVVTLLDREALRKIQSPPASSSIDLNPYLQLPSSLPKRVSDLAAQVTASGTNMFDKADLLESYLKNTYPYTNEPDTSKQKSGDIADAFLFEIKEGYCDYYSTAFVVMARSVGLPARWVKGYASGYDPALVERGRFAGELINPDGAGTFTVRNADAHSWAEVYFEGYGWIPFEPTSGFTVPRPIAADTAAVDLQQPEASDTPAASDPAAGRIAWWMPALGAAGFLFAAAFWILRKRRVKASAIWKRIRHAGSTPNQRIVREMEKLLRFMNRRGMRREDHETMRETFKKWGDKFSSLRPEFEGIVNRFEKARYGRHGGAELDAREFAEAAAKIRKSF